MCYSSQIQTFSPTKHPLIKDVTQYSTIAVSQVIIMFTITQESPHKLIPLRWFTPR